MSSPALIPPPAPLVKTYGTLAYSPARRVWSIECAPHVGMKLKRVFAKLKVDSHGHHMLSDTPQNAREIAWFLKLYPMESKWGQHLYSQAGKHRESMAMVDAILAAGYTPPDFALAQPAREYQKLGAALWVANGGLLVADDVGLGKSCTAICGLTDPKLLPSIVVTLTHLPTQWRDELQKFTPQLKARIIKKGQPYDIRMPGGGQPDVIILNYHKLANWVDTLIAIGCRSVIFDECQELRGGAATTEEKWSAKYAAASLLANAIPFRVGLSATPIYNYGIEFFSVMNILCPDALGTKKEFGNEWCAGNTGEKALVTDPEAFGSYLRDSGLMVLRKRADVGRELPESQVVLQEVESDPEELDRVSQSCAELAKLILSSAKESAPGAKMQASGELSDMLRQATGIAKAPYVAEFVRLLLDSGEKVVLYGWHRAVYAIWLDRLAEFKPAMYTGSESTTQKEESKRRFIEDETNLLIISLRAGAGLNGLQDKCHIVVFGELDWSPGVHLQCIGRVNRDGQLISVLVYYLISMTGSDPIVCEVNGIKKQQMDGLRRDPSDDNFVAALQTDGGHIKRLAEEYLRKANIRIPE